MASSGVIKPSHSAWDSPIVLMKKKDLSTRFCVDHRKLYNIIKDSCPLPKINDAVEAINGLARFSTLVLQNGYLQMEMAPEDEEKTAFKFCEV